VPGIHVERLNWRLREAAPASAAAAAGAANPLAPSAATAALFGVPRKPEQVIVVEGEVLPFKGDYRHALGEVTRLVSLLREDRRQQVTVTRLPIDTAPNAKLSGQAGGTPRNPEALFSLELVWKP
jgi:hypothetical protein